MVKEIKFFRKQAARAERMARWVLDAEISERFLNMAEGYRGQADALKARKLKARKLKAKKLKARKLKAEKLRHKKLKTRKLKARKKPGKKRS